MDFGALLHLAKQKNDEATKNEGNYYVTKFAPPKKETKEKTRLSSNIEKFLKKREEEEKQRKREQREKYEKLMSMRDEKSKNKINKMLKVTKSANKSVLADAKSGDNVVEADQPDVDDYGFVSTQEAAFYKKYMQQVKDVDPNKKFAPSRPQTVRDLASTKERVKAAITREREEAKSHTRQRSTTTTTTTATSTSTNANSTSNSTSSKHEPHVARAYATSSSSSSSTNDFKKDERKKDEATPVKTKRIQSAQPPPMDFQALLLLAEKKQHEPVVFAVPEKKKEPERLMSAREKREQEERLRMKANREQRERDRLREGNDSKSKDARTNNNSTSASTSIALTNGRIPKINSTKLPQSTAAAQSIHSSMKTPSNESKSKPTTASSTSAASASSDSMKRSSSSTNGSGASAPKRPASSSSSSSSSIAATAQQTKMPNIKSSVAQSKSSATPINGNKTIKNPYENSSSSSSSRGPPNGNANGISKQQRPIESSKYRNVAPQSQQRPPGSQKRSAPEPMRKNRIYDDDDDDDEDDYDSELDDFIDDGDCQEDISSHIRDIFGYDRRKYRDLDDDDRQMESTFAQQQREEFVSKKIGLKEDLEDMRMEAEHKKRKMAKKRAR